MKIGMKEYMGVADRMALLVLGLHVRSNVIAREAPETRMYIFALYGG